MGRKFFQFFPSTAAAATPFCLDLDGSSEYMQNSSNPLLGITNAWTVMLWVKPAAGAFTTTSSLFDLRNTGNSANYIWGYLRGTSANDPFRIRTYSAASVSLKDYQYINFFTAGVWQQVVVTWQGNATLKSYNDADLKTPSTISANNSSAMSNTGRSVTVGAYTTGTYPCVGRFHSFAIWDDDLDQANITAIFNEGDGLGFDLSSDSGNYNKSANLIHWWKLGEDADDIGADSGGGAAIDIDTNAVNISSADIVEDAPQG